MPRFLGRITAGLWFVRLRKAGRGSGERPGSVAAFGKRRLQAGAAAQYYKQLPVIEVSLGADTLAGKHARYFPGVLSEFVLREWHLPEQELSSIQGLVLPRTYDLPGRAEVRGTILFLPGLGSQPQYYLTMTGKYCTNHLRI